MGRAYIADVGGNRRIPGPNVLTQIASSVTGSPPGLESPGGRIDSALSMAVFAWINNYYFSLM